MMITTQRKLLGAGVLAALGLLVWLVGWPAPQGDQVGERFSLDPDDRRVVAIDESSKENAFDEIAVAGLEGRLELALAEQAAESPATRDSWWASLPRTGESTYDAFVLDPSTVTGKELLRNRVLNAADMPVPRDVAEAFMGYYRLQAQRVSMARRLLDQNRMCLTQELLAKGQLAVANSDSVRGKVFRRKDGDIVDGDRMLAVARAVLGEDANEESVTMTAMSMAGVFDAGDSCIFAAGRMFLLPFERLEEGIPRTISVERSVTLELVVAVHSWFHALGTLPNVDALVLELTAKIMAGPR